MNNFAEKNNSKLRVIKKILFWIFSPILLFIILEVLLHLFDYGGNLNLFIEAPKEYNQFLTINPNFGRKYFNSQSELPTPTEQLFHIVKPDSCFRIFVLGSSIVKGFPYGSNAAFSNYLKKGLQKSYPQKEIEVINLGLPATNSYYLRDIIDEVINQKPNLVLIYAGHNEYYGALGVATNQSLGNKWLSDIYSKLNMFKTIVLLKDLYEWGINLFNTNTYSTSTSYFISRLVGEKDIPYQSELFNLGIEQFNNNLSIVLSKLRSANVDVILSEVVSNLKDQRPFVSLEGKYDADKEFESASNFERDSNFVYAKRKYNLAKDYDAFRLRVPSEINKSINEFADEFQAELVKVVELFEENSPDSLIGDNLFIDFCHPNIEGHYLLAKAFYNRIIDGNLFGAPVFQRFPVDMHNSTTSFDSVYSCLIQEKLKKNWPYDLQKKSSSNLEKDDDDYIDKIARQVVNSPNFSIYLGHLELGKQYEKEFKLDLAYKEYDILINSFPHKTEYYNKGATVLLKQKDYSKADSLLRKSLEYKSNVFAYKWIGQIALRDSNYLSAIEFLSKADLNDNQVVFNLSRAYYETDQWGFGEEYFQRLLKMSGEVQYINYLKKLRGETKPKSYK